MGCGASRPTPWSRTSSRSSSACGPAGARVLVAGMQVPPNYGAAYARAFSGVFPDVARPDGVGADAVPARRRGGRSAPEPARRHSPERRRPPGDRRAPLASPGRAAHAMRPPAAMATAVGAPRRPVRVRRPRSPRPASGRAEHGSRLLATGLLVAGCAGAGSAAKDAAGARLRARGRRRRLGAPDRGSRPDGGGRVPGRAPRQRAAPRDPGPGPRGDPRHGQPSRARVRDDPGDQPGRARGGGAERRGARRGRPAARLVRAGLARLRDVLAALRAGAQARVTRRRHGSGSGDSPADRPRRPARGGRRTPRGSGRPCPTISRATAASSSGSRRRTAVRSARTARTGCSRAGTRATW